MGHEQTEWLLNLIIDQLAWLEEGGYLPIAHDARRLRISLDYSSARGRVNVSVDGGRGDIEIWLARRNRTTQRRESTTCVARRS